MNHNEKKKKKKKEKKRKEFKKEKERSEVIGLHATEVQKQTTTTKNTFSLIFLIKLTLIRVT